MSVSLEGNPGCSALGHLYQSEGDRRVCITCGHVESTAPPSSEPTAASDEGALASSEE